MSYFIKAVQELGEWEVITITTVADITVLFGQTAEHGKVVVYTESENG
jgi:hypothetical protein